MKNVKKEEEISPKNFKDKESFKFLGKKLGFLISALNISEEMKNIWLSILPKMSLKQIMRLIDVLEEDYLKEKTQYIDEEFKKVLAEIEKEKEKKLNKIDEDTIQKIEELAKKITN